MRFAATQQISFTDETKHELKNNNLHCKSLDATHTHTSLSKIIHGFTDTEYSPLELELLPLRLLLLLIGISLAAFC